MKFTTIHLNLSQDTGTYPIVEPLVVLSTLQRWRPDDVVFSVWIHCACWFSRACSEIAIHHLTPFDLFNTHTLGNCAPSLLALAFELFRTLSLSLLSTVFTLTTCAVSHAFARAVGSFTLTYTLDAAQLTTLCETHHYTTRNPQQQQSGLIFSANLFHRLFGRVSYPLLASQEKFEFRTITQRFPLLGSHYG